MPGNNFMGLFGGKTEDEHADALRKEMARPKRQTVYAGMQSPEQLIRKAGNYVSKKLGGPSLDRAFDVMDMAGSIKTLGTKNPTVLGRPSRFASKFDAAAGASTNPLLDGLKTAMVGPEPVPPKPYEPTDDEAQLLRGMMDDFRTPKKIGTNFYEPMQY